MQIQPILSPAAWKGPDVDYRRTMMHLLTDDELAEIRAAVDRCAQLDLGQIDRVAFALPGFGPRLALYRDELLTGTGVLLLRGMQRLGLADDAMARAYAGLGSHLGVLVAQSWQGELLGNIIDVSDIKDKIRGYNKGGAQTFHSDGTMCDIVALLCLRPALSGGASRIVSAVALHNAMLQRRPDLLAVLYAGYHYRFNEWDGMDIPDPIQAPGRIPVFAATEGGVCCVQETGHIKNAAHDGGTPLTAIESEAFAELQRLAASEAFFLDMEFEAGDMQFLNNRVILHGRTDYDDPEPVARRRHLLRLWLHVPQWPARPAGQMFATPGVVGRWLQRRRAGAELPEAYLREAAAQQAEPARAPMPRVKPDWDASQWSKPHALA